MTDQLPLSLGNIDDILRVCAALRQPLATKNLRGKTVDRENAYEVWQAGSWTWYIKKFYQSPAAMAKNPYARVFCEVVTPIMPEGELGDGIRGERETALTLWRRLPRGATPPRFV